MIRTGDEMLAVLRAAGVDFQTFAHVAVFTVEEAKAHAGHVPGVDVKNLFLKDKDGVLWLVVARAEGRVDLKALGAALGARGGKVSFGSPELLEATLGVTPGSVTPLALVNAPAGAVRVVLDEGIFGHALMAVHPLTNTMTTVLAPTDLLRLLGMWGHAPVRMEMPLAG